MRMHWQSLLLVALCLSAEPLFAITNVALGGRFITDGSWWQGGTTAPFDGNTGNYTGTQAGFASGANRLFGVRLAGLSTVDSFQLYITGGPGGRARPENVRLYYQGGFVNLTLPNANAVVTLPAPIKTTWLVFRELSTYANSVTPDLNYFLDEMEVYDNSNTPVDTGAYVNRVTSTPTGTPASGGGSLAAMVDGNYSQSGAFFALAEVGNAVTFSAAVDGTVPLLGMGLMKDLADSSNADRTAWNMVRQLVVSFNDPASSSFTFTNIDAALAGGATYDNAIPNWYQVLNFPTPVIGATQVTVSMVHLDPEAGFGAGPLTPTLPIGTRKTWGLANGDNNRWGVIEFEILSLPEPSGALLLGLASAFVFRRSRRAAA